LEKNIKYQSTILVGIKVAYSLYKFAHGINYFQCNEMFAIGKSFVNMVLHKKTIVVNEVLKSQIHGQGGKSCFK